MANLKNNEIDEWSPIKIKDMNFDYYPLSSSGPLLPLLDNEELLYEIYIKSEYRTEVRNFCKTKHWIGKPVHPVVTDKALRPLIRSMGNSFQARKMLIAASNDIEIHSALWKYVIKTDEISYKKILDFCYTKDKKTFITPEGVKKFLTAIKSETPAASNSVIYLIIAFGMLQQEFAADFFSELFNIFPDSLGAIGLNKNLDQDGDDIISYQSENLSTAIEKNRRVDDFKVECWVSELKKSGTVTNNFSESSENFDFNTKKLLNLDKLQSFDDEGNISEILSKIEVDRRAILSNGEKFKTMLRLECDSNAEINCEVQSIVRASFSESFSGRREIIKKIEALHSANLRVLSDAELSVQEISKMKLALIDLLNQSDKGISPIFVLRNDTKPCEIFAIKEKLRIDIEAAKLYLANEIERRKISLVSDCEQIFSQHELSNKKLLPVISELKSRILLANTMEEIKRSTIELSELINSSSEPISEKLSELAENLYDDSSLSEQFKSLIKTLIADDRAEVGYLLVHVWQRLHAYDHASLTADAAVEMLLSTAVRASLGRLPVNVTWPALLIDPWLLGLSRGDLRSNDMVQRLVVALVGCILIDNEGIISVVLSNIGALDACRVDFPKGLLALSSAIIEHRNIKLISAIESKKIDSQVDDIKERIVIVNKKYRHLQCSNAVHFSRFEGVTVFPALEKFWHLIAALLANEEYSRAKDTIDSISVDEWYRELAKQHDRPVDEHPHFPVRIRSFMQEFVNLVKEHSSYLEHTVGSGQFIVLETKLKDALEAWAGVDTSRQELVKLVSQNLLLGTRDIDYKKFRWDTLAICPSILLSCPNFAIWMRSQENPEANLGLEKLLFSDLKRNWDLETITQLLSEKSAWLQLSILHPENSGLPNHFWNQKHQEDAAELNRRREDVIKIRDNSDIQLFDECIRENRFEAASEILKRCCEKNESSKSQGKLLISSFVSNLLSKIDVIKDTAAESNMPKHWHEDVGDLCGAIERQLRSLRLLEMPSAEKLEIEKGRIESAVGALNFVIDNRTYVFDEVKYHLASSTGEGSYGVNVASTDQYARATEKCPDLLKNWKILSAIDLDENEAKRSWNQFVKEFSKICNLYRDEGDEKKRFVSVTAIKLPFLVFQTAFHKPQSDFLKRPLRLYLYRQNDFDTPALQRLDTELNSEAAAAWLHIVFAPHGSEKLKKFFRYDRGFKDFLIVDENLLYRISSLDKHDVPVRQALHLSVTDLANSSPFVAQGYCHQTNNIYVGRKDILSKLLNTPQAMIWGGRRIGKTSVLHALESALGNRKYRVAYVYVDLQDSGDPDLAIAQKIGNTLGLESINSLTDFERQITSRRLNGERFAFLIDEVDEYIKKSRVIHGNDFPLATTLRQLVMDDASKDTVLVYSGYHQLFYEAKLNKAKRRVGHPFINIAQDVPIRDLTHDDVAELVRTGFEEMLDIRVSPEVPALISIRASRHPAFVQQFCRCLLEQVSKRRSPGEVVTISKDDVEAVYQANASNDGGEQPFIFYVNETLGYNLSHLGRAIMIAICLDPNQHIKTESQQNYFSISKIRDELNVWCDVIGIANPDTEHFQQSIDLLVMTNMLTPNPVEHGEYKVTYPTYIDILRRLDSIKRADVESSLMEYESKERNDGVLL